MLTEEQISSIVERVLKKVDYDENKSNIALSKELNNVLNGKQIGVIGYGNQGTAQAQNMRDSGLDVIIASRKASSQRAEEAGFKTCSIEENVNKSDIVFMLFPDEVQPEVYSKTIEPNLKEGQCLVFASGYNIYYGFIQPPEYVDVVLLAPRMIGQAVRNLYTQNTGVPCLVACHQDFTGKANIIVKSLFKAIGGDTNTLYESSFKEEVMLDLFAEQFLWAGINKLCLIYFDKLVEAGCNPRAVAIELFLSGEMLEIARAMMDTGFLKQLLLHSQTSQYGQLSRGHQVVDKNVEDKAKSIMEEILNGDFAAEWRSEQLIGKPRLSKLLEKAFAHPINKAEEEIKADAKWVKTDG